MRRAGVWSSTRSSALRTIGEALHRASTTRGGNRRVGRPRPGRKGGISGPAATGLTFPTMQGRNALPAPSAAAAQPRAAAPIKGGACETAPVEGGFAAERLIEHDGRARLVFGVCDDAYVIDFPQRRDTAAKPPPGHARRAHRRPTAGRSRRSKRAIRAWGGARAAPGQSRRSPTATTMTVTTKKIAERTCDAKPRKAPQRDRQTGQGDRGAAHAPRRSGDEHSAACARLRAQARAAVIEAAALAMLGAAGALLGPQAAMALAGLALLAMALRSHRMEGRADPARSAPAATCADSPPVQEDRGGAKPRSPASARRPRTPRPDEKGASATPSRTKAKAAHGRCGALRRDSLGRFAPMQPDMPPADPAAPRARRDSGRARRVSDFPGLEAAGPDGCGDAAHSANRPAGGNGRRCRDCHDLAKDPRCGADPARAKRGRDSSKPDAPEPGSRSVTTQSGNRQLSGGWRRFLDVLDWPRDRRRSAVPAHARRSPTFSPPAGRRPALVACAAAAGALAGAAGGAMAQGSAAALCGLVFGPAILLLLATAVERDFAMWGIERRRFGTVSEYVVMRWLGRGPHGRRRLAPRKAAEARDRR